MKDIEKKITGLYYETVCSRQNARASAMREATNLFSQNTSIKNK